MRSSSVAPLGADHRAEQAALAHPARRGLAGRRAPGCSAAPRGSGETSSAPSSSCSAPPSVAAQPRHRAELHRVRDLVQRDPRDHLVAVDVELARRAVQVRRRRAAAAAAPRGRAGRPRTGRARAGRTGRRARRSRPRRPRRRPTAAPRAPAADALGRAPARASSASSPGWRRSRSRGRPHSTSGSGARGTSPCTRRRSASRAAAARSPRSSGAASTRGASPAAERGDASGEAPVDVHQTAGQLAQPARASRRCGPRRPRSAGIRSSGALSGSSGAGERDSPPLSRTMSWRPRRVDGARAGQRGHRVDARRGHLAHRDGDRAQRAHAARRGDEVVGRRAPASGGRPTRSASSSRRPSGVAALGRRVVERARR